MSSSDKADDAQSAFEKAKSITDNDIVNNNLGVVALMKGDTQKAESLFTSSMGAGKDVNYNLGIIKIMQGDYDAASNYLGNADEYNVALVQLLKGNHGRCHGNHQQGERRFCQEVLSESRYRCRTG